MRTTNSAARRFRQMLQEPGIIMAPGAYDCLTAKIIQQAGFPAVYMTGAGTSVAQLGYPDLALATMTEMVANAAMIAEAVDVPVIADADTGYGGVLLNVQRTVRQYQRAGVAGIHIEDQEFPKRCGHLDDKRVVSQSDMVRKIRAAVDARTDSDFTIIVRTDALAVTGWDDTMKRCEAYVEAGPMCCLSRLCVPPSRRREWPGALACPCSTTLSRPVSRPCWRRRTWSGWVSSWLSSPSAPC